MYQSGDRLQALNVMLEDTKLLQREPFECSDLLLSDECPVPQGAAGLHLLGKICRKTNRKKHAMQYFVLRFLLNCYCFVDI